MPSNWVTSGQGTLNTTVTPLNLGTGSFNVGPPDLLLYSGAAGTINLPPINPVLPSPPTTPGTTAGVGDGFRFTIKNLVNVALTVTPNGSDAIDPYLLNGLGAMVTLQASASDKKWYNVSGGAQSGSGIRSVAGAATVATSDRYLIISTAAAVTLPAPSNFPTGAPFVTIINTSGGNVTVTPASGTIQTTAAFTIATLKEISVLGDGTNFFLASQ